MAKKKIKKVSKAASQNAALASLLIQLQDRVTTLSADTNKALSGIQDQVDRAWSLENSREGVAAKNRAEVEKFGKNVTDSLYALRDNTQKAFTNVAGDVQTIKEALQRLNERIGLIESRLSEVEDFKSRFLEVFRQI